MSPQRSTMRATWSSLRVSFGACTAVSFLWKSMRGEPRDVVAERGLRIEPRREAGVVAEPLHAHHCAVAVAEEGDARRLALGKCDVRENRSQRFAPPLRKPRPR